MSDQNTEFAEAGEDKQLSFRWKLTLAKVSLSAMSIVLALAVCEGVLRWQDRIGPIHKLSGFEANRELSYSFHHYNGDEAIDVSRVPPSIDESSMLLKQIEGGRRIITRRLGQRVDTDHAGLIDAKVELPPAASAAATVFRSSPLTLPDDGQPRAVEHEMEALVGRDRPQTAPQMLAAPGERRVVGGGEVEAHHPEQGVQEPFGLAQREMVEEPQGQGGLDGEIRVPPLPTPPAAPAGRPGSDRLRGHPHRHIAASNEGLVIGRPVRNAILRLVSGMNLRLHPRSVAPAERPEKCGPRRPTRSGYSCNNAAATRHAAGSIPSHT